MVHEQKHALAHLSSLKVLVSTADEQDVNSEEQSFNYILLYSELITALSFITYRRVFAEFYFSFMRLAEGDNFAFSIFNFFIDIS